MAHGDAREGKWRGNWRMEWVASTLHTTSEHGVSSITTADAHTSAAGRQYPSHYLGTWCIQHYYRWCTHLGCREKRSGFCVCAITFHPASTCCLPKKHATLQAPAPLEFWHFHSGMVQELLLLGYGAADTPKQRLPPFFTQRNPPTSTDRDTVQLNINLYTNWPKQDNEAAGSARRLLQYCQLSVKNSRDIPE